MWCIASHLLIVESIDRILKVMKFGLQLHEIR
jgi:hypothetical protein